MIQGRSAGVIPLAQDGRNDDETKERSREKVAELRA